MAAPTNTTPGTAVVIASLPYSVTQSGIHDSGTTYTVWYTFTTGANDVELSIFGFGDLTTYQPTIAVFTAPAGTTSFVPSVSAQNKAIQIPVAPSTQYWFKFSPNGGNPTPATLTLTVKTFAQQAVPTGSLAINDDTDGFPLVLRDGTTGALLKFVHPFPNGEAGDVLDSGLMLWCDATNSNLQIWDANFTLQQTIFSGFNPESQFGVIRTCQGTQRWWVAFHASGHKFCSIDDDGTIGSAFTVSGLTNDINALAAANDESVMYYAGSAALEKGVYRWDIPGNSALGSFIAERSGYEISDILVLADDSILVLFVKTSSTVDVEVVRYDAAGVSQDTYNFGSAQLFPAGTFPRLAYSANTGAFWIWTHPSGADAGKSKFEKVQVSDGSILTSFVVQEYESGAYQSAATASPSADYGNSFSCPFLEVRSSQPIPVPPSLIGPAGLTTLREQGRLRDTPIRRLRRAPILFDKNQRIFYSRLELMIQSGVGIPVTGQGSTPVLMARWSNDSGYTWTQPRQLTVGQLGAYMHRCYLNQLGSGRQRVFEIYQSDPVPSVWIALDVEFEAGTS